MSDSKLSALSEISVPALTDYGYTIDSGPTSDKISNARLGGLINRGVFQARLTTESGVSVSGSDRSAQGTLYLTPIDAGLVRKWDGTRWTEQILSEISVSVPAGSAGDVFDVFYNGSALSFSSAWAGPNTPTDAISTQDGISCLSSDHTKLQVGTIRLTASAQTEDSESHRFVANLYNQVPRRCYRTDISTSHSYSTSSWREWNNGTGGPHRVSFVSCNPQVFTAQGWAETQPGAAGNFGYVSFSLNSAAAEGIGAFMQATASFIRGGVAGTYVSLAGFNELTVTELATAAVTFNAYLMSARVLT